MFIKKAVRESELPKELKNLVFRYGIAEYYDRKRLMKELQEARAVFDMHRKLRGDFIYDLGTGHGFLAAALAQRYPDKLFIGLDKVRRDCWDCFYPIQNLLLVEGDAHEYNYDLMPPDFVLGIHLCRSFSIFAIDLAYRYECPFIIIPCCEAVKELSKKIGSHWLLYGRVFYNELPSDRVHYLNWVTGLTIYAEELGYRVKIRRPKFLGKYTPKDIVLYGR